MASTPIALQDLTAPAGAPNQIQTIMKTFIGLLAIIMAVCAQVALIGLNGLTLISIPMTIYLGIEVLDKVTDTTSNC